MKREIVTTSKYRKELKVALKSKSFDVKVLEDVVEKLRVIETVTFILIGFLYMARLTLRN